MGCLSKRQFFGKEIIIVILLAFLSCGFCLDGSERRTDKYWIKGYADITTLLENGSYLKYYKENETLEFFMRKCFKFCITNRIPYVALNLFSGCVCLDNDCFVDINDVDHTSHEHFRCVEDDHDLNSSSSSPFIHVYPLLYCGGLEKNSKVDEHSKISSEGGGISKSSNEANFTTSGQNVNGKIYGSVYSTEAPAILMVAASVVDRRVVMARDFEVEVRMNFTGDVDMKADINGLDVLKLVAVEFCNKTFTEVISESFTLTCIIYEPGFHMLDIRASNLVSEVVHHLDINVTHPTDSDLKVFISDGNNSIDNILKPSCLQNSAPFTFQSFVGGTISFEARTAFETSSSFHWTLIREEGGLTSVIHNSTLPAIGCRDGLHVSCSKTLNTITFTEPGVYSLDISVREDQLYHIETHFKLAVDLAIKDLNIKALTACNKLENEKATDDNTKVTDDNTKVTDDNTKVTDDNSHACNDDDVVVAVGEVQSFEISVTTAFLSDVVFEVSFRSGHSEFYKVVPFASDPYRLLENSTTTINVRGQQKRVKFLSPAGSYNGEDGCRVSVTLNQVFESEGTFRARIGASIVANNLRFKTNSSAAKERVKVIRSLDPPSVVVGGTGNVFKSGEIVGVKVSVRRSNRTVVRYRWTFLCFPFVTRINFGSQTNQSESVSDTIGSSRIIKNENFTLLVEVSQFTDYLNMSFYGSGHCGLEVRAENEVSSQKSITDLIIESPIEVADISCQVISPGGGVQNISDEISFHQLEFGSKLSCHAIGLKGSNVLVNWNLRPIGRFILDSNQSEEFINSSHNVAEEDLRLVVTTFHLQNVFRRSGVWNVSMMMWNEVSKFDWPANGFMKILIKDEDKEGPIIMDVIKSVSISVLSIEYKNGPNLQSDWLPNPGHHKRTNEQATVTFDLVFIALENVYKVTLNFGGHDVEVYEGLEGSKFNDLSEGERSEVKNVLLLDVLEEEILYDKSGGDDDSNHEGGDDDDDNNHEGGDDSNREGGDDSNRDGGEGSFDHGHNRHGDHKDGDDSSRSREHHRNGFDVNIFKTYRAVLTRTFEFDWFSKDKVVSASISNGFVTVSNFTHFTISNPIGRFELKTSVNDQSMQRCSDVVVTSLVEFDDSLSFDWSCSNCSIIGEGIHFNASHCMPWSLIQANSQGHLSIELNISNGRGRWTGTKDFKVFESAMKEVEVLPSAGKVSRNVSIEVRVKGESSGVKVSIDFGDGSMEEGLPCEGDDSCGSEVECRSRTVHTFHKAGIYLLKATALGSSGDNISSAETPLVIQEPIAGLRFVLPSSDSLIFVMLGNSTHFEVLCEKGTDAKFNWTIGDQFYHDAGPSMSHTFVRVARYSVRVNAWNQISSDNKQLDLKVQGMLKDVEIRCSPTVVKHLHGISCRSNYQSDDPNVNDFKWEGIPPKNLVNDLTRSSIEDLKLSKGRYEISMSAQNAFGRVTSNVVQIQVLEPLVKVDLKVISSDMRPGRPITFKAGLYAMDQYNQYDWSFGDGSEPITTRHDIVNHIFKSVGRYEVKVNVSNSVSHVLESIDIFVLEGRCRPPDVVFLRSDVGKDPTNKESIESSLTFSRSDTIVVGVELTMDCDISNLTELTWTVKNLHDNSTVATHKIHDTNLVIRPHTLDYGRYSVRVNVSVLNTLIYTASPKPYLFRVEESPIEVAMFGGFHRSAHPDGVVVMDATSSFDPDFPEANDLSFQWNCTDYSQRPNHKSCFKDGVKPPLDWPAFKFEASDLLTSGAFRGEYMFTLTVSRSNRMSGLATQILTFQNEPSLLVSVMCKECRSGRVNSNDFTTFEAVLRENPGGQKFNGEEEEDDDDDDDYDYEWNLYVVGSKDWEKEEKDNRACVDGESGKLKPQSLEDRGRYKSPSVIPTRSDHHRMRPSPTEPTQKASPDNPIEPHHHNPPPLSGPVPESGNKKNDAGKGVGTTAATTTPRPRILDEQFNLPRLPRAERMLDGAEFVGPSTNRRRLRVVPNILIRGAQYIVRLHVRDKVTRESSWSMTTFKVNDSPARGICSKKVSDSNVLSFECYSWETVHGPLFYELSYRLEESNRTRVLYRGLNSKFKVRLPRVDHHQDNKSVVLGIKVSNKYGATTQVCSEPKRSDPDGLEVSSFEDEFRFFASLGANEFARLQIFPLLRELESSSPSSPSSSSSSSSPSSSSSSSYDSKDDTFHKILPVLHCMPIRVQMEVESTLEFLDLIFIPGTKVTYKEVDQMLSIIKRMMKVLKKVAGLDDHHHHHHHPLTNHHHLTRSSDPSTKRVVATLLDVVSKLVEVMGDADDDGRKYDGVINSTDLRPICNDDLESTFDIFEHDNRFLGYRDNRHSPQKTMRQYFMNAVDVIDDLITLQAIFQADDNYLLGPQKFLVRGKAFSFYSLRHFGLRPMKMKLADDVSFTIPSSLDLPTSGSNVIGWDSGAKDPIRKSFEYYINYSNGTSNERCYILNSILFEQCDNVGLRKIFTSSTNESQKSSEILSLNLHSCQGQRLNVNHLPEGRGVNMNFPVNVQFDGDDNDTQNMSFVLKVKLINIHEIDLSTNKKEGAGPLHIDLNFEAPKPGRFFYSSFLLVRMNEPPSMDLYDQRIFIKPRDLTPSITFDLSKHTKPPSFLYLGLITQVFKAPLRHLSQYDLVRNYSIKVWSLRCAYLNRSTFDWSDGGCQVGKDSTFVTAKCQCNHMSSYSGRMTTFPVPLVAVETSKIDDEPTTNHASIITMSCLVALYIAFLIASSRSDCENRNRPAVVHLCDNSTNHRQRYNIVVETGFRAGAGTTAKVSIVLHGKYGMSETRELTTTSNNASTMALATPNSTTAPISMATASSNEQRRMLFQRNSRDVFKMTLPESLGPIFKVQLWHNNSGSSPSWYLSRVTVHDLCTGEVFYFVFEKWFAVEKDDGKVEREVFVSDRGLGFFKLLKAKGTQYLTDHHIWLSILFKPPHSRFTHVQRLTCCLMMILTYMVLSALYYAVGIKLFKYKLLDQPSTDPSDVDGDGDEYVGDYDDILLMNLGLSGHQILVGVIVGVISFPPTQFVQFVFRRSKVQSMGTKRASRSPVSQSTPTNRNAGEEGGQTNQGYRYRQENDHALLSWRSLQEWVFAKQYSQDVIGDQIIHPVATQNDAYINLYDTKDVINVRNSQSAASQNDSANPIGPVSTNESREENYRVKLMNEKNLQNKEFSSSTLQTGTTITSRDSGIPNFLLDDERKNVQTKESEDFQKKIVYEQRSNRSSVKSEVSEPSRPPMKSSRFFLPGSCAIIAWFLVVSISVIFVAVTIYLTFWISEVKSFLWLQSVFFSILQCIFINQPLLVLIMSVYTAIRYHDNMLAFDHYRDGLEEELSDCVDVSTGSHKDSGMALEHLSTNELQDKSEMDVNIEQGLLARQRSRYLRLVRPPQEQRLIEARHQTMKENNALHFIREMSVIILQLILVTFICYGTSSNPEAYRLNSLMMEKFIRPGTAESFLNVTALKSWDVWYSKVFQKSLDCMIKDHFVPIGGLKLRQVRVSDMPCSVTKFQLVPVTRCLPLFESAAILKDSFSLSESNEMFYDTDPDLPMDRSPKKQPEVKEHLSKIVQEMDEIMGDRPTLSQRPPPPPSSNVPPPPSSNVPPPPSSNAPPPPPPSNAPPPATENDSRTIKYDASESYTQFTLHPLPNDGNDDDDDDPFAYNDSEVLNDEQVWSYQEVMSSATADYYGWFGNYGRNGFILDLQNIKGSNRSCPMKFLRRNGWVDLHTSVLILTITFYHPPSNLFSSVAFAAELPPIGRVFSTFRISTVNIYKYLNTWDRIVFACELLFFVVTFLRIHHKVYKLVLIGSKDVFNFWNLLEISLCLLSVSFIGCYIYRYMVVCDSLENLRESFYQDTGADTFNVANWDQVLRVHLGFVLIALGLFFLKSLQRQEPFDSLFNVIGRSRVDVAILAFVVVVWLGAFISCGMMVFGSNRAPFGHVSRAIGQAMSVLLFRPFAGDGNDCEMSSWNSMWPFYHAFFLLFAFILLFCYIRTSLIFNFRVFRSEPLLTFTARETSAFYWTKLKILLRLDNQSNTDSEPVEEADGNHLFDQLLPEFTMTEMENQVDEVLFKMNALTGGSNLPEKPTTYYSDTEMNAGIAEDGISSRNSDRNKSRCLPLTPTALPSLPVSGNSSDVIDVYYHKQILMKLELEVLKQTKKQSQQQLQPSRLHPTTHDTPPSLTTPSSSLSLSSSSPQLSSMNRKNEDKTTETRPGTRLVARNLGHGRPPLPRASPFPTSPNTEALSSSIPNQSNVPPIIDQASLPPLSHKTFAPTNHNSLPPTNHNSLPPMDGGLRRSRSVRCRKLETMAEETEEVDASSKLLTSGRRGKSADSNFVAVFQNGRAACTGLKVSDLGNVDACQDRRCQNADNSKTADVDLTTKSNHHPLRHASSNKHDNVIIEITPSPIGSNNTVYVNQGLVGIDDEKKHRENYQSIDKNKSDDLDQVRGSSTFLRECNKDHSKARLEKTLSFELRQERPTESSQQRRLFGTKKQSSPSGSLGSSNNSDGKTSFDQQSGFKKSKEHSKCKRTKSLRVIDDLV